MTEKEVHENREKFLNHILTKVQLKPVNWKLIQKTIKQTTGNQAAPEKLKPQEKKIQELSTPVMEKKVMREYIVALGRGLGYHSVNLNRVKKNFYTASVPVTALKGYMNTVMSYLRKVEFEKDTIEDKVVGCLLGLAIGDAMGITYEIFPRRVSDAEIHETVKKQRETIQKNIPKDMQGGGPWKTSGMSDPSKSSIDPRPPGISLEPGDFTDDTSMTLCLADSLIKSKKLDLMDIMMRLAAWWTYGHNASIRIYDNQKDECVGKPVGMGRDISMALDKFKKNPSNPIVGRKDSNGETGNCALVRVAPISIFWNQELKLAMEKAAEHATITHNLSQTKEGCSLIAYIICMGLNGSTKNEIFESLPRITPHFKNQQIAALTHIDAKWKDKKEDDIMTLPGSTLYSLEAALWCLYHTENYEDAIIKTISLGGDADTIGAIVGQMAGAIYGASNIPIKWIQTLKHGTKILNKAIALLRRSDLTKDMKI